MTKHTHQWIAYNMISHYKKNEPNKYNEPILCCVTTEKVICVICKEIMSLEEKDE